MISIYVIFAALATTALANITPQFKRSIECNFSGHTEARCSGAVGQLLLFHLPSTANTEIRLKKDHQYLILKVVKNQTEILNEEYVSQSQLFPNGTFKLGNAMKKHSGEYMLEEFRSNGILAKNATVHLEIHALVSKPAVSQMCLSAEQMKVSCSSEGDGVEFILTVDGLLLIKTRGHSQSQTNWTANMQSPAGSTIKQDKLSGSIITISLHGQMTGNVVCHVQNNFSRNETAFQLKSCKDFSPLRIVIVAVMAGLITLVLLVALCLGIRNLCDKPRPTAVNAEDSKEMSEIVYADVTVIPKKGTTRPNSQLNAS